MSTRSIVILVAICVLSFVAGIWTTGGRAVPARGVDEAPWTLPGDEVLAAIDAEAFLATSRAIRWTGSRRSDDADVGPTETKWRLLAIVRDPAPVAVVDMAGRLARMREGDVLPSGEQLTSIEDGAVVVTTDGCETRWRLYQAAPERDGACHTNAADDSER
ncbi:hypothetical protein [Coralloluteibacterium stylophorae]|uniref:Uncharacterized protein n=1 Tax=Coralloluteibacterium stylophorae TaxID=1776034 RepID=A0A8J7VTH0_9GAMM|nr:hypothetical protein [Coralloluteibacterium stylophorae]MBS7457836.1 hypothetical protein [Coralloluteibacterium stylophorae]